MPCKLEFPTPKNVYNYIIKRKCGADFRLSSRRLWKDLNNNKRCDTPHLDSMRYAH